MNVKEENMARNVRHGKSYRKITKTVRAAEKLVVTDYKATHILFKLENDGWWLEQRLDYNGNVYASWNLTFAQVIGQLKQHLKENCVIWA